MTGYGVYGLRCLNRKDPKGIGESPRFSWKLTYTEKELSEGADSRKESDIGSPAGANTLHSGNEGIFQKSYQVNVWEEGRLIWDSGIREDERTTGILYDGPVLKTGTDYQWQVVSYDREGRKASSKKAFFSTGILEEEFWKAHWIESGLKKKLLTETTDSGAIFAGKVASDPHPEEKLDPAVYFRREFAVKGQIRKARMYVTALGNYILLLDGQEIGNLLAPEYTAYRYHLEYQTYDVTALLKMQGEHAIGMILANGWYSGKIGLMGIGHQYGRDNALLFQMEVEYTDGTRENICSDGTLRWSVGGYLYADLFVGEYLDYAKIPVDFSTPGFDDTAWKPVKVKEWGVENLCAQSIDPVWIVREIKPKLLRTPKGEWVLDAGENICGYTKFAMKTPVGVEIGLEHSEVLDQEGNFLQNIMGQNKNQKDRIKTADSYTVYEPRFTFHGFRYVRVTGVEEPRKEDFTVCVLTSRMDTTGSFRCSDGRLNQLQENIFRSQQGNMLCVPTDCPQRERAGWTGDMEVYAPTAAFNMDVQSFLRSWLKDMRLEQHSDGQVPHVIPDLDSNKYVNSGSGDSHISSSGWADACVLVPYALYRAYGDTEVLEENYEMMKKWMDYVESHAGEDLCSWGKLSHFGDWLIPSIVAETHNPMLTALWTKEEAALVYLKYTADRMAEIARVLGNGQDAEHYSGLAQRAKEIFSKTYVSEDGMMRQPLQGLYVLALAGHMLTKEQEEGALQQLCELIHEMEYCLDTGFLSVPFLLDVLFDHGASKEAYKILFQDRHPGWLYALKWGATTIWENWAAILPNGIRTNSSYNHFAFGCVGDFIYRRIGGLQAAEPGYKKVRIDPDYSCGLDWAETEYDSINGKISIRWEKREEKGYLKVMLPPNTRGLVRLGKEWVEIGNGQFQFSDIVYTCGVK